MANLEKIKIVEAYIELLGSLEKLINESGESLSILSAKTGLSRGAINNKKKGHRRWFSEDVKKILLAIGKKTTVVEAYEAIINNLEKDIEELGFRKKFLYEKANLTQMKFFTRMHEKHVWFPEEILLIAQHLYK